MSQHASYLKQSPFSGMVIHNVHERRNDLTVYPGIQTGRKGGPEADEEEAPSPLSRVRRTGWLLIEEQTAPIVCGSGARLRPVTPTKTGRARCSCRPSASRSSLPSSSIWLPGQLGSGESLAEQPVQRDGANPQHREGAEGDQITGRRRSYRTSCSHLPAPLLQTRP